MSIPLLIVCWIMHLALRIILVTEWLLVRCVLNSNPTALGVLNLLFSELLAICRGKKRVLNGILNYLHVLDLIQLGAILIHPLIHVWASFVFFIDSGKVEFVPDHVSYCSRKQILYKIKNSLSCNRWWSVSSGLIGCFMKHWQKIAKKHDILCVVKKKKKIFCEIWND